MVEQEGLASLMSNLFHNNNATQVRDTALRIYDLTETTADQIAIAGHRAVPRLFEAFTRHKEDPEVVAAIAAAVSRLAYKNTEIQTSIEESGLLPELNFGLDRHKYETNVIVWTAAA